MMMKSAPSTFLQLTGPFLQIFPAIARWRWSLLRLLLSRPILLLAELFFLLLLAGPFHLFLLLTCPLLLFLLLTKLLLLLAGAFHLFELLARPFLLFLLLANLLLLLLPGTFHLLLLLPQPFRLLLPERLFTFLLSSLHCLRPLFLGLFAGLFGSLTLLFLLHQHCFRPLLLCRHTGVFLPRTALLLLLLIQFLGASRLGHAANLLSSLLLLGLAPHRLLSLCFRSDAGLFLCLGLSFTLRPLASLTIKARIALRCRAHAGPNWTRGRTHLGRSLLSGRCRSLNWWPRNFRNGRHRGQFLRRWRHFRLRPHRATRTRPRLFRRWLNLRACGQSRPLRTGRAGRNQGCFHNRGSYLWSDRTLRPSWTGGRFLIHSRLDHRRHRNKRTLWPFRATWPRWRLFIHRNRRNHRRHRICRTLSVIRSIRTDWRFLPCFRAVFAQAIPPAPLKTFSTAPLGNHTIRLASPLRLEILKPIPNLSIDRSRTLDSHLPQITADPRRSECRVPVRPEIRCRHGEFLTPEAGPEVLTSRTEPRIAVLTDPMHWERSANFIADVLILWPANKHRIVLDMVVGDVFRPLEYHRDLILRQHVMMDRIPEMLIRNEREPEMVDAEGHVHIVSPRVPLPCQGLRWQRCPADVSGSLSP